MTKAEMREAKRLEEISDMLRFMRRVADERRRDKAAKHGE